MGYEKKSPSIKLLIGRELFDKLVGLLESWNRRWKVFKNSRKTKK